MCIHCYKNWWKIASAPSGGADQTIRVMGNNFNFCDGHIRFFQHFRCKFSTVSKFSEYILYSKDGNFRLFVIFQLYFLSKDGNFQLFVIFRFWFLFKGWNTQTFEMVFPDGNALRKLNSTGWARSSVLWHTSQVFYRCATLSLVKISKKIKKYFCSIADEYCLLVFLCCRKRLSPK